MNLQEFFNRREEREKQAPRYRDICMNCWQPGFGCYCQHVETFDPFIKVMILIHPIEVKRRIATGRMSHLCLKNSELVMGQDYSGNHRVNEIIADPKYQPFVLYPGPASLNLTEASFEKKQSLFQAGKTPVLFVIDGTWATARKMMRQSRNLHALPRICFTPPGPSRFRVRKQPSAECYSTIEAIHHSIELLAPVLNLGFQEREHDKLLKVFDKMVERQLDFIRDAYDNPKSTSYRRPRKRI